MSWACYPDLIATVTHGFQYVLPLFAKTVQAFLATQCALVGDHLWPNDAVDMVLQDPNYDFIVVGAGSAGAVVANRLSEIRNWKVLLIEAGGNPTLTTEIPQVFLSNVHTPVDWGYRTTSQETACKSYTNQRCAWPRGKVLGGTSSINAMFYVRGNKADYDEWAADGNKGWSYSDVLPYFMKSENYSAPLVGDLKKYHDNNGYLSVENKDDIDDLENIVIQSAKELGMKFIPDINGASQMGVTKCATTTKSGIRQSTARAFLSPVKNNRTNLHVLKNAYVIKILFKTDSNVVSGVLVNKGGKDIQISASKEVVLSAGAINTPQLLMLSGIGPFKHLTELGIKVKADLPVGENLQDHPYVGIYYKFPGDKLETSIANITGALAAYMLIKKGSMASTSPNRVISYMNSRDPKGTTPDIQFHYVFLPSHVVQFIDVYDKYGLNNEFRAKFNKLNEHNSILIVLTTLLKPKSRGKILLKNKDPFQKPLIYANYFKDPYDLATTLKGLKHHALKLAHTQTLRETGFKLAWLSLDSCRKYDKNSDEFLKCWARQVTFTMYGPAGTAKMGRDDDNTTVVNNALQVRKVQRLRVIDASIMPSVVRGDTNAPTIMIGEKGADLIKKYWLMNNSGTPVSKTHSSFCWAGKCFLPNTE